MAANGISILPTKEERQLAKLELAQTKRQLTGTPGRPLKYYDINLLPTKYVGNTLVNNPGALLPGHPWKATPNILAGLWRSVYTGYWSGAPEWFDLVTPVDEQQVNNFNLAPYGGTGTSYQWLGYFRAPHTANYIFYIYSDDESMIWIGNKAITAYNSDNTDLYTSAPSGELSTMPISLTAGDYVPIRVMYGNNLGEGYFNFSWSDDLVIPFPTYERVDITGSTINTEQTAAFKLTIQSSTFQVFPHVNAQIGINDLLTVDTSLRGHTVLAMQPDGTVIEQNTYDTFGDTPQQTTDNLAAMNAALQGYTVGTVVAICVYDAGSIDATVRATLNTSYGGTLTDTWAPTRYSHIFIGQKV